VPTTPALAHHDRQQGGLGPGQFAITSKIAKWCWSTRCLGGVGARHRVAGVELARCCPQRCLAGDQCRRYHRLSRLSLSAAGNTHGRSFCARPVWVGAFGPPVARSARWWGPYGCASRVVH